MRLIIIVIGLCILGCYGQQPMFNIRGNAFQSVGGMIPAIPASGQFNPNLARNTLNTGVGVNTQGFTIGTQSGVQGFQPGVQGFQPGVQGFQPGVQGFQPGVQGFQPGVQGFQPGVQGFQPGVQGFQPGVQGFQPGVQGFQPGVQGFQPGIQGFQPGVQGFQSQPGIRGFQPGVQSFQPGVPVSQPGIQGFQPGVQTFQTGTFQTGAQGFQPGVGVSTTGVSNGINMQNQIRMGMLGQTNTAMGGFSIPFGPFSRNGLPFGFTGFTGFPGQAPTIMGPQVVAPMSPIARLMMSLAQNPNNFQYATCNFNSTWNTIRGRVDFRQFLIGDGRQQVNIRIQVSGLPQTAIEQERGIHIHEFGDIGDACARVGPHFNPNQTPHGSQRNVPHLRHVGDIGNIRQSTQGMVSTQYSDSIISLEGMDSIVGRSLVIKFERDDEGLMPGSQNSQVNGNTREPIACCTVGRTNPRNWYNPMSAADIQYMGTTGIMPEPRSPRTLNGGVIMNPTTGTFNPNINTNFNSINGMGTNTGVMIPGVNVMTSGLNNNMNTMGVNTGINTGVNTLGTNFNTQTTGFNGNLNLNPNPQASAFRTGMTSFGTGSFSPGVGQGQTFNFNQQGKKKRRKRATADH